MKYIKHIILTAFAMVVMGAWAQTVPTQQSDGTWQFTMPDANKLLEVNYGLVLTVGPNVVASSESGLIDNHNGTYTVDNGTTVILTATPAEHYHLASWSNGATVNTHDTIHVTVTKDTTVTATFAPNTYSLTLGTDPTEGGSVFFTGYPLQTVTWVGKDIAPTLNLSSQYPSEGNSDHATIDGVTVTCNRGIVEPSNNGYYLRIYSYYNSNHPSLNDIVFTCPDGKTFTKMVINFIGASGSYYTEMPGATLNGYVSYGTGSITWIGNATSIGYGSNLYVSSIEFSLSDGLPDGVQATSMENVYSVEYGTEVDLTAAPNDHYHFVKWTDQHSTAMGTSEQLQFTFTKDSTITGKFAIDTFELSFGPLSSSQEAIDAHGWVTIDAVPAGVVQKVENSSPVEGTYKVPYGTKITLRAIPDADYHLQSWAYTEPSMTHVEDFEQDTTTITVTGAQTVTGNFAIDSSRIDSVRLTWQVKIGNAAAIYPTPYVTENPTTADTMGYVMIPKNADVVITPSDGQKELVSKLDLIPIGAINGKFSVGSNKQVYFSKGNLQATTDNDWTNWTFSFMEHQYSMVETLNQNVGVDYNSQNVVSLFGWGTSGYNHGATYYQPNRTNKYPQNYYAYGDAQKSLFDESGKADWGYNAISNGGNTENSGWRTLTNKEWVWLLGPTYANSSPTPGTNCRTSSTVNGVANARFAKAYLFGTIHGLIIFPDNYTHPEGVAAPTGINATDATSWDANTYSSADWAKMEAAGAVFLPAAGRRPTNDDSAPDAYTVVQSVGNTGCYWSSTDSTNDAQQVLFGYGDNFIVDGSALRSDGHSVRLVKMATVSASAQTDPYVPARNSDNSWTFKMPTSDLMLRTAWKQDAGLAYAKADTTVYRGLSSTVQNPLTKPNGISVTYSITPESGTTTNNVINPSTGEVTIHGTGIDTVKARFAGNNDYLPDSAMYILRTLEPWKLTLATVGDGTVVVPPSYTLTFSGTDNNYNPIVVNNYDGTSFSSSSPILDKTIGHMLEDLYGDPINPINETFTSNHVNITNQMDVLSSWIVVTGTFSEETITFKKSDNEFQTITVSCTPNMNGIDVDPNNSNKYYVVPGTEVTVKATPDEHNHFTKWTSGSTEMALTETMSFTVTSDTTVTANFAGNVYTVTANTNGNGSVTGGGSITYPNSATLVATANEHYHFVNWTSPSNTVLGTETTLVVQPTSDSTVNANFAIDTFELSFGPLASSQEAIDAHGSVAFYSASTIVEQVDDDTYKVPYGTKVTLKATPDADYHLRSWTYSNSSMTHVEDFEQDTTTITVTGAQTVTGNFAIDSSRIDSVRLTWQVQIGNADPISPKPYVTENPTTADTMGYVMIPIGAEFLIIPSDAQKELVSKLELVEPCVGKLVDLSSLSKDTVLTCGDTLTGTLADNYKISIADGATVTLAGVTINGEDLSDCNWAGITCEGDATIILKDGTTNTVTGFRHDYPGIFVPQNKTLTIKGETAGTGTLTARSNVHPADDCAAGIGAGYGNACGNILIESGAIAANGGKRGAGIGGAVNASCGTITINGGTVDATGGAFGAGIGSGGEISYSSDPCGTITIKGGTVTATGGEYGAGIGSGDIGKCQSISITGGIVIATGGSKATGVGSGTYGTCAGITIANTVTSVTAIKGTDATNSIGAGNNGSCGTVTIGGTEYYKNNAYVGEGATYLAQSTLVYPAPPTGAIGGKFSVSSNKQVYFSQGNLQYTKSTGVWSFMEHQYSTVETTGSYCTNDYGNRNVVSLFGWATSGYNHGATCYQPYSTNTTNENYYAYGDASYNLYDQTGQADWGYNAISNGGNTVNSGWRTLTTEEWQYLFANHTKGWSTVNGVNGYVIRPDGVSTAIAASYTASAWETEEAAGAVFLPAAGYRNSYVGTDVYDKGSIGRYWSSSADDSNANYVNFSNSSLGPDYTMNRNYGLSVRLVKDAQ